MDFVLTAHEWARWPLMVLGFGGVIHAGVSLSQGAEVEDLDRLASAFFLGLMDLQLLIGTILLVGDAEARRAGWLHAVVMVVAVAVAHVLRRRFRSNLPPFHRRRALFFFFAVPLALMLVGLFVMGQPAGVIRSMDFSEEDCMSMVAFSELPSHARLWIFGADRVLEPREQARLTEVVEQGLAAWAAHGSPVTWGHQLVHDQFLMIGVNEKQTRLTGCSIDNAVGRIRDLEKEMGIAFLDNGRVFYRDQGSVRCTDRAGFRKLAQAGAVDAATVVMNNTIAKLEDLRSGLWEVPARDSWHGRAFPLGVA